MNHFQSCSRFFYLFLLYPCNSASQSSLFVGERNCFRYRHSASHWFSVQGILHCRGPLQDEPGLQDRGYQERLSLYVPAVDQGVRWCFRECTIHRIMRTRPLICLHVVGNLKIQYRYQLILDQCPWSLLLLLFYPCCIHVVG